ncbi:Hsp70 family protein [Nocardia gamkensis]|uniref:Hsp70 family protein n=1 Tax=Nocardia gamkensis TaxID=352869 RepID=A0A7X6L3F2_9NOCA|nr:Hsp70 family protein [Nocardia gamkensis]NKY27042.1 Hsp70 family protein [Nocardia gamkensis]NQE70996.1 Heat shock cognate 70 kDa protein 4 [Nocardia gamkensis]
MAYTVGIDLGTTYSAVAVVGASGRPEILVNRDGERLTPSVVFFDSESVLVGSMAKRSTVTAPLDVAQFVKRQMGNPDYRFVTSDDRAYSAEEVSAMILRRLKEDAELVLGQGQVTDAVITVPAFFDDARRRATRDAGTIAGLNVLRVVNEPTAAGLAFGLDRGSGTVMVYDLGGGTFDVTVMRISDGVFDVLGTDGLHELGGFEWDNRLMQHLNEEYMAQGGGDLTDAFETEADLREKAELAKRTLSSTRSTRVVLSHDGVTRTLTVTRETFEDLTSDLLNQSRDLAHSLVEELSLRFADIDHTLLVGGSTRMPMVATMLEELTGKPPLRAGNPDELVALGAALRAEAETSSSAARKPVILDVTSQALGTVALNDSLQPGNSIVIPRNTKIPAKASKVFGTVADGQTEVRICVTQGDDEDIDHVRFVTKGKWPDGGQLFAIPPYPANAPVLITFHYDMDQTIQVEITDLTADRSLGTFEVDNVANLSATDIRAARTKNENLEVN